jgi:hypothetical protein
MYMGMELKKYPAFRRDKASLNLATSEDLPSLRWGRCRVGSLAGAAHLSHGNAGVPRRAQRGQKPRVERKGKSSPDSGPQ